MSDKPIVGIVMGSKSDLDVVNPAVEMLSKLGIASETRIYSAHRTPRELNQWVETARERGLQVIIAAAGGAAALPGCVAAETSLPVIGLPIQGKAFLGLDSLLSIVQMPGGVPVATVGVNNAKNAAVLAARIIALNNAEVLAKLTEFTKQQAQNVLDDNARFNL